MSTWTRNRKRGRLAKVLAPPTLLVSTGMFFMVRRGDGRSAKKPFQISKQMMLEASEKYERVILIERPVFDYKNDKFPSNSFYKLAQDLKLKNFKVFQCLERSAGKITNYYTARLKELNIGIKRTRNIKEVTFLNLGEHIDEPNVTWASMHSHSKVGITLEKELTFKEMEERRKARSLW